jgi:autoinducer 2-degrading protein
MIVTCVYIKVKSGEIKAFIDATVANHLESIKEPGNLRFDFIQQADDPCRFMIY